MADVIDEIEIDDISEDEQQELTAEIERLFTQRSELPEQGRARR